MHREPIELEEKNVVLKSQGVGLRMKSMRHRGDLMDVEESTWYHRAPQHTRRRGRTCGKNKRREGSKKEQI